MSPYPIGLVLLLAVSAADATLPTYSVVVGETGGPLRELESEPTDRDARIFYHYAFLAEGRVAMWQIYSKTGGTLHPAVFRVDTSTDGADRVTLIGRNTVPDIPAGGFYSYVVPHSDRISVQPGDVIGLFYTDDDDSPVLTLQTSNSAEKSVQTLQSIHERDMKPDEWVAKEIDADGMDIPLSAVLTGTSPFLQLMPAPEGQKYGTNAEGVAMIFKSSTWGTICDRWYHQRGWPLLLCLELGYPNISQAIYKSGRLNFLGVGNDHPVMMESPRCKPSTNGTVFTCDIKGGGECSHEYDLYIACSLKVNLGKADQETYEYGMDGGVPIMYVDGYWGTICDSVHELAWLNDRENNRSWTQAFCHELGYPYSEATYARDKYGDQKPEIGVSLTNPECGKDFPSDMKQCPGTSTKCDHAHNLHLLCYDEDD